MKHHTVTDSPYGPLTLVADNGVLRALYMTDQRHRPPEETFGTRDDTLFARDGGTTEGLLRGRAQGVHRRTPPDRHAVPEPRSGTGCSRIPYGETRTYGELADALGAPAASRAVGLANGRNPIGIIVPCHRVIGANGEPDGLRGRSRRQAAPAGLRAREPHSSRHRSSRHPVGQI
ncbi:Methylated-DNA--protein-cysteine methyltransferase OS=Streptomyces violarus OX=67380 GN=FHS41_001301 PE=3 SV=1 [Streptomyces violarus]